jgi:predicted metalloprotease with PDZ domain
VEPRFWAWREHRPEAFVVPGAGSSDALLDWLRSARVEVTVHDLREECELAEAIARGFTRFPVLCQEAGTVVGFDPAALDRVFDRGEDIHCGLRVRAGRDGHPVVTQVLPGTAGAAAGLHTGDTIVQLGGSSMFSVEQLRQVLGERGNQVRLLVRRGGRMLPLTVMKTGVWR